MVGEYEGISDLPSILSPADLTRSIVQWEELAISPDTRCQWVLKKKDAYVYSVVFGSDDVIDTYKGSKERKSAKPWTWLLKQIAVVTHYFLEPKMAVRSHV